MRKILFFLLLIFVFTFIFIPEASAQVVINEFSSSSNPEWVELYNNSTDTISLETYTIYFDDSTSTKQKYKFCNGEQILGNSYKLVTRPSGKPYWLANDGDILILKELGNIADSINYGSGQTIESPNEN